MNELATLAGFCSATTFATLPAGTRRQVAVVLADSVGAMVAGAREAEVRALVTRRGQGGAATIVGSDARTSEENAALLNGIAGTAVEMDEGNHASGGHPAMHVIPAALATAEIAGATGAELVTAIACGYEVAARVGAATRLGAALHPHGTWGVVGAAAAVARLRRLALPATIGALQIAATLALATSRTSATSGATVRNAYAGVANRNGMLACDLAQSGFTGEANALAIAFGQVLGSGFDATQLTRNLGGQWQIGANFIKLAASCRETHGALDSLESLLASLVGGSIDADSIATIRVETFESAAGLGERQPTSPLAARFSIPFTLATRIVNRSAAVESFAAEALSDARVRNLANKVEVSERPDLTARIPYERIAEVRIELVDGRFLYSRASGNRGDFDQPVNEAAHAAKFLALVAPTWGGRSASVREACLDIANIDDVRAFVRRLGKSHIVT